MKKLILILMLSAVSVTASAAWWNGFMWISNVCVAPNGEYWIYPIQWARPVGEMCKLPSGQFGVVE